MTLVVVASLCVGLGPKLETTIVDTGSRRVEVRYVRLKLADYEPDLAWPSAGLGTTADMAVIAKSAGAEIAVNGCFFDAYLDSVRKNPNQNLLAVGRVVHIGGTGCTLGFDTKHNARIERVRFKLQGTITKRDGRHLNWYAYRVNHTPRSVNIAGLFDAAYGSRIGAEGLKIVVEGGKVVHMSNGNVEIPRTGYVLLLGSGESSLQRRFEVGDVIDYRLEVTDGDIEFWRRAMTGVGGGPKLVSDGKVDLQPDKEGFTDPKILSASAQRSLIGVTPNSEIVIALASCRIREAAILMQKLGCREAMNLDGGASSGLWMRDKGYLQRPGRPLNNLLVFRGRR
jgi:hypothetical protein